jgi:hypothetical protein
MPHQGHPGTGSSSHPFSDFPKYRIEPQMVEAGREKYGESRIEGPLPLDLGATQGAETILLRWIRADIDMCGPPLC